MRYTVLWCGVLVASTPHRIACLHLTAPRSPPHPSQGLTARARREILRKTWVPDSAAGLAALEASAGVRIRFFLGYSQQKGDAVEKEIAEEQKQVCACGWGGRRVGGQGYKCGMCVYGSGAGTDAGGWLLCVVIPSSLWTGHAHCRNPPNPDPPRTCPPPLYRPMQYGDIERLDLVDEYSELSHKTGRLFAVMSDTVHADFYFKIDDDVGECEGGDASCVGELGRWAGG